MLVKPMSLPARKQEHQEGWYKTHAAQAVPFGGEALQDAGHLLAHDLKLGHLRGLGGMLQLQAPPKAANEVTDEVMTPHQGVLQWSRTPPAVASHFDFNCYHCIGFSRDRAPTTKQQLQHFDVALQSRQMKSGAAIIVGSVDKQATLQQVFHGVHISQRGGKGHGTQGLAVALLYSSLDNVLGPTEQQHQFLKHVQE
ncbi:MAG: hypothetical protein FRX49_05809 [Trebouxia sp. A1-2]|nr:MAG: hypothetical protein FRX49_05809 [Trebouxia sp. A1-2]